MREQSERETGATDANGKPRGRIHVRNCYTGCAAFRASETGRRYGVPGAEAQLSAACAACDLRPGWMLEADAVVQAAGLPDAAIEWAGLPYWLANGIGLYRAMNRGGF